MIGNAHTCIDDREIITIRDDGIEIKFSKPSGGVEPLRQIGDQSSKPVHMNWRLTPQTAKNFPAFELVEHGQRFFGFDRRQAQGRVLQCFDPHAAKTGHYDGPEGRIAPRTNREFHARCRLLLQECRSWAEPVVEVFEGHGNGSTIAEAQLDGACVAFVHEPGTLGFENDWKLQARCCSGRLRGV
jgi:hypothetical protein